MTEERVQRADAQGQQAGTVTLTVPSHPKYLYVVRRTLHPLLYHAGFSIREARRIILAVDEACSNIIKHAYGGDPAHTITVTVADDAERFTVRLRDYGRQVDRSAIAPRDLADVRPGGLGTHFMQAAFDSINYDTGQGQGTLLTLEKTKLKVKA
jgi:anti-sigma regulatory factor (Ser/Thr protein kinase)